MVPFQVENCFEGGNTGPEYSAILGRYAPGPLRERFYPKMPASFGFCRTEELLC